MKPNFQILYTCVYAHVRRIYPKNFPKESIEFVTYQFLEEEDYTLLLLKELKEERTPIRLQELILEEKTKNVVLDINNDEMREDYSFDISDIRSSPSLVAKIKNVLTEKEFQIAKLWGDGNSCKTIGLLLDIEINKLRNITAHIREKILKALGENVDLEPELC